MAGARHSPPTSTADDALQYDAVVVPRYSGLFAQLIVDEIPQGTRATVLDVGCGSGTPAFEVVRRLGDGGRVIGIDRDQALIDLAQRRASIDPNGRRLFFKCEAADELHFGADVFDLVVGNLVLGSLDGQAALPEMRRVLVPGGQLLVTQAMSGSFEEALDCLREIAIRTDRPSITQRVETVAARYPTPAELTRLAESTGFDDVHLREESVRLSFRSPRELFVDPLLRLVGIPEWRWIAGFEPGGERVLEQMERTLETYFGGGPLSLTIHAGLLMARRPL